MQQVIKHPCGMKAGQGTCWHRTAWKMRAEGGVSGNPWVSSQSTWQRARGQRLRTVDPHPTPPSQRRVQHFQTDTQRMVPISMGVGNMEPLPCTNQEKTEAPFPTC